MSEISRGCPSSGWVLALTAGHPHLLSHWSEEAQAEIYGATGDAARSRPAGPGRRRRSPRTAATSSPATWDYASGCDHSTHFMGSAIVHGERARRGSLWLLIDRADYEIVDNWDVIGLRGTGSKRVVCEGVHVPEHRVHHGDRHDAASGRRAGAATRTRSTPAACSRLLFFELGAIAVGAARGRDRRLRGRPAARRPLDIPPFVLRGEVDEYQHHLGDADRARRRRGGGAARGGRPLHRPGDARLRGRPAGRRQRRGDAAAARPAAALHPAVPTRRSTWSSGRAARAARAAGTRSATR